MDVRGKLVELLKKAKTKEQYDFLFGDIDTAIDMPHGAEYYADFLIAHGVTVQELDGCEYCKEDGEGFRKANGVFCIARPFHGGEWFIRAGNCKPRQIYFCPMCGRKLTEPPKGE